MLSIDDVAKLQYIIPIAPHTVQRSMTGLSRNAAKQGEDVQVLELHAVYESNNEILSKPTQCNYLET